MAERSLLEMPPNIAKVISEREVIGVLPHLDFSRAWNQFLLRVGSAETKEEWAEAYERWKVVRGLLYVLVQSRAENHAIEQVNDLLDEMDFYLTAVFPPETRREQIQDVLQDLKRVFEELGFTPFEVL
jgi:hypothetical protein